MDQEISKVKSLQNAQVHPFQILQHLKNDDPASLVDIKGIHNAKQKLRRDSMAGQSPFEYFLSEIKGSDDWVYEAQKNEQGLLQNLFFAHNSCLHLAKIFHHVCLVDSTYHTNKYKLP